MHTANPITAIELRHLLHQNPELMFKEFKTTEILYENLKQLLLIKILKPLETGLVIEYAVNNGDYILFRADIDALPILEKTNYEFASNNNLMHACGHDVHSSILYGFINEVVKMKINQNIIFVFQPAEEGGGGAEKIIRTGIFDKYKIKNAFALHVTDEYDFGTIATTSGELFASSVEIDLFAKGKSSHVAFPENGVDALRSMRLLLDEIDKAIASETKPILFGCGKIYGGTARNILPEDMKTECTLRTLSIERSKKVINKFNFIKSKIENATKAKIEIKLNAFYTEVVNDKNLYEKVKKHLKSEFNFIDCGLKMTAEDFGFFTKKYPSFMFWLGTSDGKRYGLHTPYFLPDDKIIKKGVEIYLSILNLYLTNK